MDALGRMIGTVKPGGLVLDLQVTRPDARVELHGRLVAEIDCKAVFRCADAAAAAVNAQIRSGDLVEEAFDDHDVRQHYADGAELVEDFAGSTRRIPEELVPAIAAINEPLVVREHCRLRRLRARQ